MCGLSASPSVPVVQTQSNGLKSWLWWPLGGFLLALPFLVNDLWPVVIPGFMVWLHGLETAPKKLLLRGYLGGICFVYVSLAFLFALNPVIHVLTAMVFGLYVGIFAVVTGQIHRTLGIPVWFLAPAGIVLMETLPEKVSIFSTTWLHLGYVLWEYPRVMQLAEVGGVSMLSALLMLMAAVLYHTGGSLWRDRRAALRRRSFWLPVGTALVVLIITFGFGTIRLHQLDLKPSMRVALVQTNIPQALRSRDQDAGPVVVKHATMSLEVRDHEVDLVVWPESAVRYFMETSERMPAYLGELAQATGTPLLLGSIGLNEPPAPPSNSAFVIDATGELGDRADKHILVPFAETLPVIRHIPSLRRSIGDLLGRTMGFRPHLSAGDEPGLVRVGDHRVGVLICYDDAVPGPAAMLHRKGAEVLITLSNEAWFPERELAQHVAMATVRCIETRLPMARSTHTGETCIIEPSGRITARLPYNQEGILFGTLETSEISVIPAWVRLAFSYGVSCAVLALYLMAHWRRFGSRK